MTAAAMRAAMPEKTVFKDIVTARTCLGRVGAQDGDSGGWEAGLIYHLVCADDTSRLSICITISGHE